MYRPTVTIKGCLSSSDAQAWIEEREIRLNLPNCKRFAKRNNIEFIEFVARCLNHEFLHHLFDVEHDYVTSHALDNIAKKNKDVWLW